MIIGLRTTGALVCLLLAQIGLIFCQTSATQDRVAGWRSDLDFLLSEMRRQHYIYRSQPLPEALERRAAELRQAVPRFGDERMLAEFQRLMSFLGDGHCYIMPAGAERVRSTYLPLRFYLFSDGLYVIDADAGHDRWIGSRIVKFGNVSADDAIARVGEMISKDNPMGVKWVGPFLLRFRGFLEAIGSEVGAGSVKLELEGRDGRVVTQDIELTPVSRVRGIPKLIPSKIPGGTNPPLYLSSVSTNYWFEELPNGILYFQFNQVMVGEENQITLPWSGAIGSISNRYHESIPGDTRVWIEPEIKVELSSKDYFANRDPVLEAVLKRYQK